MKKTKYYKNRNHWIEKIEDQYKKYVFIDKEKFKRKRWRIKYHGDYGCEFAEMIVKLKRGGDEHSLEGKSEKDNWEINVKGNNRELLKFKHIVKDLKRGKINDGDNEQIFGRLFWKVQPYIQNLKVFHFGDFGGRFGKYNP